MVFELSKWRPFGDLDLFRRELDEMFSRFFPWERGWPTRSEFVPPVDVIEGKNDVLVKVEVPGIAPEDIDISITGDTLTIRGEKKFEKDEEKEGFFRRERAFGAFMRTLTLPCPVDRDKTDARYRNGILEIALTKAEESKPHKIKVHPK